MRCRAKNSAIREQIALLRANRIARITSDFKMDLIKVKISVILAEFFRNVHRKLLEQQVLSLTENINKWMNYVIWYCSNLE